MQTSARPIAFWDESPFDADVLKRRVKAQLLGVAGEAPRLGPFALVRCLGRGASGTVYEAIDTRDGGEVAVKLLRRADADAIARFKAEFRGLTHVVHDNLARLYELFADGDTWCFSMELVRGPSFNAHVRGESCDEQRLRGAMEQLLRAVHALHSAGTLHRDLKPSNVLVTHEGRVVVLDFGLLTAVGAGHRPVPSRQGTPEYMAPEVDAGHAPSTASDAYAIGVMLFQALTGRLPWSGSPARITRCRREQAAPQPRALWPDAPDDLNALCTALLERDPRARATIGDALRAFQVRPSTLPAPPPAAEAAALVGRTRELDALRAALADARGGHPIAALIAGRMGSGKSALVEHFAASLPSAVVVLRARCHERESVPHKAFDGVIDALAAHLETLPASARAALAPPGTAALLQMFPQLATCLAPAPASVGHAQRDAAFDALKELLRRLAQRAPLVLIVDDLQWADRDSAQLLLELLGPPAAPAMLYVGCYREEQREHCEFLRELLAHARKHARTFRRIAIAAAG
jgi:hypothetical protein